MQPVCDCSSACPLILVSVGKPGRVLLQYGNEIWRSFVPTKDHCGLSVSLERQHKSYIMYLFPSPSTSETMAVAQPGLNGEIVFIEINCLSYRTETDINLRSLTF